MRTTIIVGAQNASQVLISLKPSYLAPSLRWYARHAHSPKCQKKKSNALHGVEPITEAYNTLEMSQQRKQRLGEDANVTERINSSYLKQNDNGSVDQPAHSGPNGTRCWPPQGGLRHDSYKSERALAPV